MKISSLVMGSCALLLVLSSTVHSEKVGKVFYEGFPQELNGKTSTLPGNIVALSEAINVPSDSESLVLNSSSIMFVIDHSGSMYNYYAPSPQTNNKLLIPRDTSGFRFEVTKAIIDTMVNHPDRYPGVECGLAVFTNELYFSYKSDSILLKKTSQSTFYDGAYIPLLKIDSTYETSYGTLSTNKIFEKYLETKNVSKTQEIDSVTYKWNYKDLTIAKNSTASTGTNVDAGFEAAIAALKNSSYNRDHQFVVFISDGESNTGYDDYVDGIEGNDTIPTTFTVFFTIDGTPPQSLLDMNNAIKSNAFSSSNDMYTQIWTYKNSSLDSLVGFFMENIVKVFEGQISSHAKSITLKNITIASHFDSLTNQFIFDNVIPFTSDSNNIQMDLEVTITTDTVDQNGDTVSVDHDTTINIENIFKINPAKTTVDSGFKAYYWDRNIVFRNNGSVITKVDETMKNIEVMFTNDPLDSKYKYSKCVIDIKSEATGDVETIVLTKSGDQEFIKTIPIEISTTPSNNDGILEHSANDRFIATFRNNESVKLPLDTLQTEIRYAISTSINIEKCTYFDNNADGSIDSIAVQLEKEDDKISQNEDQIVSLFTFPDARKFKINSSTLSKNIIGLNVIQNTATVNTAVKDEYLEIISDVVLNNGGIIPKQKIAITDSLAPVILSAKLTEHASNQKDTLSVTFSEDILSITDPKPLSFYSSGNGFKEFSVSLSPFSTSGSKISFEILSYDDNIEIESGDSVNIDEVSKVADINKMYQLNPSNIKRKIQISVVNSYTSINSAAYFDDDANGWIDRLSLKIPDDTPLEFLDTLNSVIKNSIEKIPERKFSVDSIRTGNKGINFYIKEGSSAVNTAVFSTDKILISQNINLGKAMVLENVDIDILDSVAPVITKAILRDSLKTDSKDVLFIKFSEAVKTLTIESTDEPFLFYRDKDKYSVKLEYAPTENANGMSAFYIKSISKYKTMNSGDSVHINYSKDVSDNVPLAQHNSNNIKVPLEVVFVPIPVELELKSTAITPEVDFLMIILKTKEGSELSNSSTIDAEGQIYDAVGNLVFGPEKLIFDSDNKYAKLKWNGLNNSGRTVESAAYLLVVNKIKVSYWVGNNIVSSKSFLPKKQIVNVQR